MVDITNTALSRLESEGRLLNAVLKAPTPKYAFGFRGELAVKFTPSTERESRPPEILCQQVLTVVNGTEPKLPFFAGYLLDVHHVKQLAEVLGDTLKAGGKYFAFCNNVDFSHKYQLPLGGALWYILPLDESTVWNEMLSLMDIDKNDIKKLDTAGKLDYLVNKTMKFDESWEVLTYDEAMAKALPVRDPGENRPV